MKATHFIDTPFVKQLSETMGNPKKGQKSPIFQNTLNIIAPSV